MKSRSIKPENYVGVSEASTILDITEHQLRYQKMEKAPVREYVNQTS